MLKPVSLLFILVLCCSGYLLLILLPNFRFKISKSAGYHTFLQSIIAGISVFILASTVYFLSDLILRSLKINFSISDLILNEIFQLTVSKSTKTISDICVISFLIDVTLYLTLKVMQSKNSQYLYESTLKNFADSPENPEFTDLFFRSARLGLPILFTLSDRKVFIGYISTLKFGDYNDIEIIPMYSGYRDKDTLKIELVTPYLDILDELRDETIEDDIFCVSMPLREIIHAHLYDFTYQDDFRRREDEYLKGLNYSSTS